MYLKLIIAEKTTFYAPKMKRSRQQLIKALNHYSKAVNTIIIGLPRGGVPMASVIAKALHLPLDIVVPRKLGAPFNEEYAIGAITEDGEPILNATVTGAIDQSYIDSVIEEERTEAQRRLQIFRGDTPSLDLTDTTAIIVDDGIATGYTMEAAIASARHKNAKRIVIAVPVGASDTIERLTPQVDEMICLHQPMNFAAVGQFYDTFLQTSDEEVIQTLANR